jgi:hypothetical protein
LGYDPTQVPWWEMGVRNLLCAAIDGDML